MRRSSVYLTFLCVFFAVVTAMPGCGDDSGTATVTVPAPVESTPPGVSPTEETSLVDVAPLFGGITSVSLDERMYRLEWTLAADETVDSPAITYKAYASEQADLETFDLAEPVAIMVGTPSMDISDPGLSPDTYFMVRACDPGGNCDDNTVRLKSSRGLGLETAPNLRDLGGYINSEGRQMRWEWLYRSNDLTEVSDEDLASVAALGLERVIDLRFKLDFDRAGFDRLYEGNESIYDFVPMSYGDPNLSIDNLPDHQYAQLAWDVRLVDYPNWYISLLEDNREGLRQVFERLADPSQYPLMVHCSQGKDRAGVAIALVLMLLDVPQEVVIDDYILTCELTADDIEFKIQGVGGALELYSDIAPTGVTGADWRALLTCREDSMANMIDHIETVYGGAGVFLESIGITPEQQQVICDQLLYD